MSDPKNRLQETENYFLNLKKASRDQKWLLDLKKAKNCFLDLKKASRQLQETKKAARVQNCAIQNVELVF